tara:strand:- start:95 stop:403 length:309 start_codon:yes stop_codon:yes gene_type:complete
MDQFFGNVLEQVEDLTNFKKTPPPLTNSQAISNFMYFGHNFPHDFILKVWGGGMGNHLKSKFNNMAERHGTMTFFSWFMELDEVNKKLLTNWVEKNYRAFSY